MNILFLTSTLPRFANDMQAGFVLEQAAAWRQESPDDKLFILAPHDKGISRSEMLNGIEIRRFRYFLPEGWQRLAYPAILPNIKANPALALQVPPFIWSQYNSAKSIIRDKNIDLIYAHWVMPQGLVARRLSKATGIPYVIHNHSSDLSVFAKFGGFGVKAARDVMRDALAMFCVNSSQKDYALSLFDAGEREQMAEKISVLPMGVILDEGADAPPAPGRTYRYDMGTISRLSRKKGLDLLIHAAEQLAGKGMRPLIAIAGDGEERDALQKLPANSDIHFPGFMTGTQKAAFFAETRNFLFPAAAADGDVEGMPVALLEALCCGKMVLASRDTNIMMLPEWDRLRNDIFYVDDPRDIASLAKQMTAMLQIDSTEEIARSERIRAVMARYRWPNLIREYQAVISLARRSATISS
jgi:glycosyltransferase involved in cell wall biosynthesis